MKTDDIGNIVEAYNSIYEAVTDRPAGSSNTAPYGLDVNPKSKEIRDKLFATQPKLPTTPVSPGTTGSPTTFPSAASTTTPSADIKKTFQQELDDLRKASAKATMVGPSKEAQALMSQRTKNILGPEKLAAGIKAQQEVEKMKSEIGAPKPQAPQAPTIQTRQPQPPVSSTAQTRQPQPPPPPAPPTLTKDQLGKYNEATGALKNPLTRGIAKDKIRSEYVKMTPEQKKIFKDYLNTRPQSEKDLYKFLGEQQIGIPLKSPTDSDAAKVIKSTEVFKKLGGKVVIPKSGLQQAHYEPDGEVVVEDVYDEVLNFLLEEGCTLEESNYIMTYIVEQGMHPQEIMARGIANILGLDKPHPTQVFAQGLRKMLYPNKPQEVKAPKPPIPKLTRVASPATKPSAPIKPNPYRPGATIRATGPNMDKFPELQRFAGQARRIAEPVAASSALRNIARGAGVRGGIAAAVLAPRPTGDATLTGALRRGDYRPQQGPKNPDEGLTRAQSFDKAYKAAKQKSGMGSTFTWNNKSYKVA